jgi:hypothetical protein
MYHSLPLPTVPLISQSYWQKYPVEKLTNPKFKQEMETLQAEFVSGVTNFAINALNLSPASESESYEYGYFKFLHDVHPYMPMQGSELKPLPENFPLQQLFDYILLRTRNYLIFSSYIESIDRLRSKAVFEWYADCCNSIAGITENSVGVSHLLNYQAKAIDNLISSAQMQRAASPASRSHDIIPQLTTLQSLDGIPYSSIFSNAMLDPLKFKKHLAYLSEKEQKNITLSAPIVSKQSVFAYIYFVLDAWELKLKYALNPERPPSPWLRGLAGILSAYDVDATNYLRTLGYISQLSTINERIGENFLQCGIPSLIKSLPSIPLVSKEVLTRFNLAEHEVTPCRLKMEALQRIIFQDVRTIHQKLKDSPTTVMASGSLVNRISYASFLEVIVNRFLAADPRSLNFILDQQDVFDGLFVRTESYLSYICFFETSGAERGSDLNKMILAMFSNWFALCQDIFARVELKNWQSGENLPPSREVLDELSAEMYLRLIDASQLKLMRLDRAEIQAAPAGAAAAQASPAAQALPAPDLTIKIERLKQCLLIKNEKLSSTVFAKVCVDNSELFAQYLERFNESAFSTNKFLYYWLSVQLALVVWEQRLKYPGELISPWMLGLQQLFETFDLIPSSSLKGFLKRTSSTTKLIELFQFSAE